ncbi:MAG: glycerol-3-phosphate acyltransferase [Candidatus Babeliales bacterium]|nr:glycerol-3-phosphate acyltransferase [Candidatus Babeliales bacterium]
MFLQILLIFMAYVIGSIPSGLLIARMCGVNDIRAHGSGNIGATNVSRVLGYKFFIIVLLADSLKAFGYLKLLEWSGFSISTLIACAAALFLGNGVSLFLKFRGGKGVATLIGILAAMAPWTLVYGLAVWSAVFALTKTVGVASIAALCALPFVMLLIPQSSVMLVILACWMSILGVFFHRDNIKAYLRLHGTIN